MAGCRASGSEPIIGLFTVIWGLFPLVLSLGDRLSRRYDRCYPGYRCANPG